MLLLHYFHVEGERETEKNFLGTVSLMRDQGNSERTKMNAVLIVNYEPWAFN